MTFPDEDPSLVTALRYDEPAVAEELATWCGGELEVAQDEAVPPTIWVPTVKGPRPAAVGDWIVRRASGDYYPCTAAVFEARHEPVE